MSDTLSTLRTAHQLQSFDRPDEWVETALRLRESHQVLLLDEFDRRPSLFLAPLSTAAPVVQLQYRPQNPDQDPIPRLSDRGLGEVLSQEARLARWPETLERAPSRYRRRRVRGKGIFVYPLGPVHADVAECVQYLLSVMGDEIVQLDLRHHFKPRYIDQLAQGQSLVDAVRIVERTTGTSTVAHALAFCQAVEAAGAIAVPPEHRRMRSILAELERVYSHLGDLASLAASTGLTVAQMDYLHQRETVLRLNHTLCGHRYLRGLVVVGGVAVPAKATADFAQAVSTLSRTLEQTDRIAHDLSNTPSFLDRLHGAGKIPPVALDVVRPVGPVGRAAGFGLDVRVWRPYQDDRAASIAVPVYPDADAYTRFRVRVEELHQSLLLLIRWLAEASWPSSPPSAWHSRDDLAEGVGLVEAPRGQLVYRAIVDAAGVLRHVACATPSERNWAVVAPAIANRNILQDFPIIDASFALSVAGWDR